MPIFKSGKGLSPKWCELEYFEIVNIVKGSSHIFNRVGKREKIIVVKGKCKISINDKIFVSCENTNLDLSNKGNFEIVETIEDSMLIRMCGRWGKHIGNSGSFTILEDNKFDNHYHDCDEYWIIFEGRGIVISEGKKYEVGSGDCVATGMGYHHDFPKVFEPVKGVYFETTMEGKKRTGHLWEHKHGKAIPKKERI